MNKEGGNIAIIVIGVALILFLIGFFRSEPAFWGTINFKQAMRLPCGLTLQHPDPKPGEHTTFPFTVDGYVNGCGWSREAGNAGTAQVFDGKGMPVTAPVRLTVPPDSGNLPYYFTATMLSTRPPTTDGGNLILKSSSGLIYAKALTF